MAFFFKDFTYKLKEKPCIKNLIIQIQNTENRFYIKKIYLTNRLMLSRGKMKSNGQIGTCCIFYEFRDSVGNVECDGCKKDLLKTGVLSLYESNTLEQLEGVMDKQDWWIIHKYMDEEYEDCNDNNEQGCDWYTDNDLHLCPMCDERLQNNAEFVRLYKESGERSDSGEKLEKEDTQWEIVYNYL